MKRYISQRTGKQKQTKTGRMTAVCILLITAIVTLTVGITLAKMRSTASGSDSIQVAAFIVEANEGTPSELLIDCNTYKTTASYTFAVTNTKDGKPAEVSVKYDLIVTLPEALPAGVTMTINGKAASVSEDGITYTLKDAGTFQVGIEATYNYTLTFTADTNLVEEDYMFEKIQVSVHAEQVD